MPATRVPQDLPWVALAKLTYGSSPGDLAAFKESGLSTWVDSQLDPKADAGADCTSKLAGFRSLTMSINEASRFAPFLKNNDFAGQELSMTTLIRRLFSNNQLFEMLVEHFNDYVHVSLNSAWQSRMAFDRDVVRAHVLGTYPDMLVSSSVHPAMLEYLNGNDNTKDAPNENYGRELQELHTITSQAGYLQKDVVNAARVFSGISWDYTVSKLLIDPDQHWLGPVSVFRWTHQNQSSDPAAIKNVTESLVRYLALRPETAKAFSRRLARRFVSDDPPDSLLAAMSAKYLETNGDIPSVVRTMILSAEFGASAGQKVKRPMEHFGSVVRALNLKLATPIQPGDPKRVDDYFHDSVMQNVIYYVAAQGHEPMTWPFPNGFPDRANPWTTLNGQVRRWNFGSALAYGWNNQDFLIPDYDRLLAGTLPDAGSVIDTLALLLLGTKLAADDRKDILPIVANAYDNTSTQTQLAQYAQTAASLILAMPTWNFR
jgi:uncharacterized protein (DUF1800 family)